MKEKTTTTQILQLYYNDIKLTLQFKKTIDNKRKKIDTYNINKN